MPSYTDDTALMLALRSADPCRSPSTPGWTRRLWLTRTTAAALATARVASWPAVTRSRTAVQARPLALSQIPDDWASLAQRAIDVAQRAGARYTDTRLTRTVQHVYANQRLGREVETVGIGVRALVNGYWGFAACPSVDLMGVDRVAQDAVTQAATNARGTPRTVDLGPPTPAVGTWATPVEIDPFTISPEEKLDFYGYWVRAAERAQIRVDTIRSHIDFTRQDRMVMTSEGAHFVQTLYESGGLIACSGMYGLNIEVNVQGITTAGRGWELFLNAKIPEQFPTMSAQIEAIHTLQKEAKPVTIGRYTVVCDGVTMASLLDRTLGAATQLDRALGYEANAAGTSYLTEPLTMLGTFKAASPHVTISANRSAPAQLATVRWDDEGVESQQFPLVKDGVLVDFQTTREQAAWLAPYYQQRGQPLRSRGCAAAESALFITMQHSPNLDLAPNSAAVHLDDLIADVPDGVLITDGQVMQIDFQTRSGLLVGQMREIKRGRLGRLITGGALLFDALDLWRNVIAVGGAPTEGVIASSQYPLGGSGGFWGYPVKGQPPQATSHSVQSVAATIMNQTIVNPARKI